jgi:hypothetical protein
MPSEVVLASDVGADAVTVASCVMADPGWPHDVIERPEIRLADTVECTMAFSTFQVLRAGDGSIALTAVRTAGLTSDDRAGRPPTLSHTRNAVVACARSTGASLVNTTSRQFSPDCRLSRENIARTLLPKLLPNSVARTGTGTNGGCFGSRKVQIIRDILAPAVMGRDGLDRISRPVP